MNHDESRRSHVQAVRAWLDEHVRVYPTPSHITLRQIELDRNELCGKAMLYLGDASAGEELTLRLSETGWLSFSLPLYHSPLGAPATYGAVELTARTERAVTAAVQGLLPRLVSLGIHPKTRQWVTTSTPLHERIIDVDAFNAALDRVTRSGFECVQGVEPVGSGG